MTTKQPKGTVLCVDDNEANRNTFALVFRDAGFEVVEAATGSEALRLAEEKPDLILLDVNLPDIDGFEVCRHIRAHPATNAIPVMHMSGVFVTPEDRTHALEDGADVYLTKPVEPRELVAQARALLRTHQAEEKAAAVAREWQATFAAINDGVCVLDQGGHVLRCNDAAQRLLQRPSAEILGRHCDELLPLTPGPSEPSVFARMLQTRRHEMAELAVDQRWLQISADPMLAEDATVTGAVYILADVTERKRLEEQLRQSQKMEALGRLASGIAHDFNNLLTAIAGSVSLLLSEPAKDDSERELLVAIDQAAWRAAELTQQLLGFSRRTALRLEPLDVRACIDEVARLLRRTIDPRITLEVRSTPDLWPIRADPGQINQVLMNLCLNARDAMPEGGQMLLDAENIVLQEQAQQSAEARPGEFVRLRVRDTGQGISPEVLPHLFEPFFTTKEAGKGTGLGLATVYGIVGRHQGWIECSSTVHQGACFDVYLPRLSLTAVPRPTAPPAPALCGTETILLADDDPVLRTLGQVILRHHGYEVLVAEHGEEAAEVYRREAERIGLVILDLSMPGLSWRDTLRRLVQVHPGVRVVLTSGHSEVIEPYPEGVFGFLTKPYRAETLAAEVRKALDSGRGEDTPPSDQGEPPAPLPGPGQGAATGKPDEVPGPATEQPRPPGQEGQSGLSKAEAEELLDWLEAHGYQGQVLFSDSETGFAVRWQQKAQATTHPRRSRLYRQPCAACGSTERPYRERELTALSWVLIGFGVVFWPLLIVGLRLRREVWRCWDCHRVRGRTRLTPPWRGAARRLGDRLNEPESEPHEQGMSGQGRTLLFPSSSSQCNLTGL
jgi:PAS domain S-box-containing protein